MKKNNDMHTLKGHSSAGSRRRFREDGTGGEFGGSEAVVGDSRSASSRDRFSSRRRSCSLHCSGVYAFLQPISLIWKIVRKRKKNRWAKYGNFTLSAIT